MKLLMRILIIILTTISFDSSSKDNFLLIKNQENKTIQITSLNAKAFKSEFEKTSNAVLLDVRTPEEFSEGHIEKAINMDFKSADFEKKIQSLDKTKSYFLYCKSGNRTKGASDIMKNEGFKHIIVLQGGILAWEENNFPVVK